MHDNVIPMLGVVTDIRVDTPDIKTFRVEAIGGGKVLRAYARSVRDAVHPRRGRGDVFHHLVAHD